jgi:transposase
MYTVTMEITELQYKLIQPFLPRQRGNVSLSNLHVLNAILYVAEQGCKWRGLPKHFGSWHTIYTRMNRWAKSGVLDRVFVELQQRQIIQVRVEAVSLDSTAVKVHPDGTGTLKKRAASPRKIPSWVDHQDSSGCRRCSDRGEFFSITGQCRRCARRA